jgi:hypothetical protein
MTDLFEGGSKLNLTRELWEVRGRGGRFDEACREVSFCGGAAGEKDVYGGGGEPLRRCGKINRVLADEDRCSGNEHGARSMRSQYFLGKLQKWACKRL